MRATHSYWTGAALTLEPRLSSRWIASISFFGTIVSLPVPIFSFQLLDSTSYLPLPPPLSTILENVLPSMNLRNHFTKGLQSSSGLVQHCTALALARCLLKLQNVIRICNRIGNSLEENEEGGLWYTRRREIEREARKRVPDLQVIIALSQLVGNQEGGSANVKPNQIKTALLAEAAQRLLWMYQRSLPELVAEARFDFGKLLVHFSEEGIERDMRSLPHTAISLHNLRTLHTLRLLQGSDQFAWSGKCTFPFSWPPVPTDIILASSSRTYLYALLKVYLVSEAYTTRTAIASLVAQILSRSALFYENSNEPTLWLFSLPNSWRVAGTEAPDGASMTDEGEGVITFLDECVQKFLKAPHIYAEMMHDMFETDEAQDYPNLHPSPLLMTVVEQLCLNIVNKHLSASDLLAVMTFVRKLMCRLRGEMRTLKPLQLSVDRIDTVLCQSSPFAEYNTLTTAVRREVSILRFCLLHPQTGHLPSPPDLNAMVQRFLTQVEHRQARKCYLSETIS